MKNGKLMHEPERIDGRDTFLNGALIGLAVPFLGYFLFTGLNTLLLKFDVFGGGGGFSLKFVCMLAVLANILPIQIFHRQHRDSASRGVMTVTMLLVFALVYYFRDQLLG